ERRAREQAQMALYANQLALARSEADGGDPARAREVLDECRPELRGWEGRHVRRRCPTPLLVLGGHDEPGADGAFAADGPLSTCGHDGSVRLWDRDGKPLRRLAVDGYQVHSVAFRRDGRRLAAAAGRKDEDSGRLTGSLRVWDADGKPVWSHDP